MKGKYLIPLISMVFSLPSLGGTIKDISAIYDGSSLEILLKKEGSCDLQPIIKNSRRIDLKIRNCAITKPYFIGERGFVESVNIKPWENDTFVTILLKDKAKLQTEINENSIKLSLLSDKAPTFNISQNDKRLKLRIDLLENPVKVTYSRKGNNIIIKTIGLNFGNATIKSFKNPLIKRVLMEKDSIIVETKGFSVAEVIWRKEEKALEVSFLLSEKTKRIFSKKVKEKKKERQNEFVSFRFENADIRAVIKAIADVVGVNVIIDPEVKGKVSIDFSKKPVYWKDALDKVLKVKGFTFVEENGTVRVLPKVKEPIKLFVVHLKHVGAQYVADKLAELLSRKSIKVIIDDNLNYKDENKIFGKKEKGKRVQNITGQKTNSSKEEAKTSQDTKKDLKNETKLSRQLQEENKEVILADTKNNILILKVRESTYLELKKIIASLDALPKDVYTIKLKYLSPEKAIEALSVLGELEEKNITVKRWDPTKGKYVDEKKFIYTITLKGDQSKDKKVFGVITVDPRSNTLIYKGDPAGYQNVIRIVSEVDKPRKRIRIKAKIVQVESTAEKDVGISWGVSGYNYPSYYIEGSAGFNTQNLPGLVSSTENLANVFNIPTADNTLALGILNRAKTLRLNVALKALQLDGKAKIVSSPEILTLDNEQATITQGIEIPYIKTTSTSAGVTTDVEFRQASLILSVKPHITPDGQVLLDLEVRKDSPNYTITQITGNPNPAIDTRSAKAKVRIKAGDTIVIGGIYEKQINEDLSGVPVLSQIPLLGWLFKSKTTSVSTKKLLIFITPEVIE
ncbi:MAG: secretin N-terminal domain-containing protein [Desulfurobacteriaceae bacterium]